MHLLATIAFGAALILVAVIAGLFAYAQFLGWTNLAKRYGIRGVAPAGRYRVDTVLLGPAKWFGPPMRVEVGPEGIDLLPPFPYRLAFRPVRIPGAEIVAAERRSNAFFEILQLHVGRGPTLMVGFPPSDALYAIQKRLKMPIRPVA
jgi:hypothetical protein